MDCQKKYEDWSEWVSVSKRPHLSYVLHRKTNYGMKILTPAPEEKDKGQEITILVAYNYHGEKYISFWVSVITEMIAQNGHKTKQEIFVETQHPINSLLLALDIKAAEKRAEINPRGAGRKPLNYEIQREIAECISAGKSVRKTAEELHLSTRTVQKYAKILVSK